MTKRSSKRSSMEARRRKGYASFEPDTPAMRILAARDMATPGGNVLVVDRSQIVVVDLGPVS